LQYIFNRLQVEIAHLSEIVSLLGYQGLKFFCVSVEHFPLIYPVEPVGAVFIEYRPDVGDNRSMSFLIEVNADQKFLVIFFEFHDDILRFFFIAVFKDRDRFMERGDKIFQISRQEGVFMLFNRELPGGKFNRLFRGKPCLPQNLSRHTEFENMVFGQFSEDEIMKFPVKSGVCFSDTGFVHIVHSPFPSSSRRQAGDAAGVAAKALPFPALSRGKP